MRLLLSLRAHHCNRRNGKFEWCLSKFTRQQAGYSNLSVAPLHACFGNSAQGVNHPLHFKNARSAKKIEKYTSNAFNTSLILPPTKSKNFDLHKGKSWHDPTFMKNSSPEEKEIWLESLIRNEFSSLGEKIDATAFNLVLDAWSYSDSNGSPQKTEYWISRMENYHEKMVDQSIGLLHARKVSHDIMGNENDIDFSPVMFPSQVQPNIQSYNAVIRAWSRSKDEVSVVRAERWFTKMQQIGSILQANTKDTELLKSALKNSAESDGSFNSILAGPNTESFTLFIKTCSKGLNKKAITLLSNAEKAEGLLNEMVKLHDQNNHNHVVPNTECFNHVLVAWTKCTKDLSIGEKIMKLLRSMEAYQRKVDHPEESPVRPNTASYTNAMNAWGIVAATKARQFNNKTKANQNQSNKGYDIFHSNQTRSDKKNGEMKTNNAQNGYQEVHNAEAILSHMHDLQEAGHPDVAPDTACYNCLLKCWANISNQSNKSAPLRAERVFREMIDLQNSMNSSVAPDHRSYSMLIHAWSRLNRDNSAKRAHWWLEKLKEEYMLKERDDLKPNTFAYNVLIKAYANLCDTAGVERVLNELIDNEIQKKFNFGPNTDSFLLVISAWVKFESYCSVDEAGEGCERAYYWLSELIDREQRGYDGITTSAEAYNNVLKATRISKCNDLSVLEIAMRAFTELDRSHHHVRWISYKWLLDVGLKVLSREEDNIKRLGFIEKIIRKCCDDGLLARGVVQAVANSPVYVDGWTRLESDYIVRDVFGDWPFPKSWSRNVQDKSLIPSKEDLFRKNHEVLGRGRKREKK